MFTFHIKITLQPNTCRSCEILVRINFFLRRRPKANQLRPHRFNVKAPYAEKMKIDPIVWPLSGRATAAVGH